MYQLIILDESFEAVALIAIACKFMLLVQRVAGIQHSLRICIKITVVHTGIPENDRAIIAVKAAGISATRAVRNIERIAGELALNRQF